MGSSRLTRTAGALILLLATYARPGAGGQTTATGEAASDSDPTRPVFVSIRPELHNFRGHHRQLLVTRYDTTLRRVVILRFEVPAVRSDNGLNATAGLGDAYGQFLIVPYAAGRLALVAGSGVVLPSATDERLGAGKWILAPLAAPLWRLARGLVYVKLQNFTSAGGDGNRPDVNYLLITPTLIRGVGRAWWVLADTETRTNWRADRQAGVKSGLQIGRRIDTGIGLWVKTEVWWGAHRDGTWNVKIGLVWYQRRVAATR